MVFCVAALFGCKAKKQLVVRKADSTPVAVKPTVYPALAKIAAIKAKQVVFNTFSGRAKTKLTFDGKSNDVTLNIRVQHGKRIWVSVTALLGIEVARALITPDSILVINRLQGVYIKKPFSYIYTYASRQVNYLTIESLLVGNVVTELLNENNEVITAADGSLNIKGNLQGLAYNLLLGSDLRATRTTLANTAARQSLQIINSQFVQADSKIVPSQININSTVPGHSLQAELEYNRTEFNQVLEYPFSIPERFEPAN